MRTLLWLTVVAAIGPVSMTPIALAQDNSSHSSVTQDPSNSGNTNGTNRVDDRTGNANTMNSQGSTSGPTSADGTVGSSIVPPASPNASRNPSGSGTSTSGGVDYNGDKGADKTNR